MKLSIGQNQNLYDVPQPYEQVDILIKETKKSPLQPF